MTSTVASVCYRFGRFELQPDERRLLASGAPVHLGPHAFDVLMALVERGGHLVTKDDLLERVWGKVVVEENTLQAHISVLRKVLGANAITTVAGRGYRFTQEVIEGSAAPSSAASAPKHNLPHSLTSFIGREKEIAELKQLLGSARLLTLTGSGGCGKTRLAIQLARQRAHAYPDGAWLVEFAALTDAALLPQTIATVLGIKEKVGARLIDTIAEHLASRSLLLILDNAEHLIDACARLAESLLQHCERLVILVTSREQLRITGELTYRVPSLSVPDEESDVTPESIAAYESARLLIERARLHRPDFEVVPQNSAAIASICRRLGGIALALELAAPRVRTISVEELSRRLDRRFEVLTEGSRTALPRHRTLRALIDWSYDLLTDAEKAMLRRMSIFAGGWTLEAAEQVFGADAPDHTGVLELLTSLADKNLIVVETHDGATRYGILETVRDYAQDQLRESGEEAETQRRHLGYFLAFAEEAEPLLTGAEQRAWLDRLEMENDNLRSALAGSVAAGGDAARGLRLGAALSRFWGVRGYLGEGRGWLSKLLGTVPGAQTASDRARALSGAGTLALSQGDGSAAEMLFRETLLIQRKVGDRRGIADTLNSLGLLAQQRTDYATAKPLHEEGLAIGRDLHDLSSMALSLCQLGNLAGEQGDYAASRTMHEESLALYRELGDRGRIATLLGNLGTGAFMRGDFPAAQAFYEEALTIRRELGDRQVAYNLGMLGSVASARRDFPVARAFHQESLAIHQKSGDRQGIAWALEAVAFTLAFEAPRHAARLWGRAELLREEMGAPLPLRSRREYDDAIAAARATLGDDGAFEIGWREGRAMTLDQAVDFALGLESAGPTTRREQRP